MTTAVATPSETVADWQLTDSDASPDAPDRRRWWALGVVLAGAFMILLDSTIVNVAIPTIQENLEASFGAVEWVISGYALAYGLMLIPAGRLADQYGHKRLFLIGLAGFTATSIFCGTATAPSLLIGWRVAQGAMAGIMNPAILAIIQTVFPRQERGRAFGMYGAVSGIAVALGPLLGGIIIQLNLAGLEWQPIFLLNVPIGIVTVGVAFRVLGESGGRGGPLDLVGILLMAAALLLLTVPLIEGRAAGWPRWTVVSLLAVVPMFAAFAAWEHRQLRNGREPLIDLRLFGNRAFLVGVAIGMVYFAGFIGLVFALSLVLQIGLGQSALAAGLTLMPFAMGTFVGSALSDRATQRLGRWVILLGAALVAVGIVGLILTVHSREASLSGWNLIPSLLLAGIGSGFVIAPNVDIVLAGVPWQDAGTASGVLNTAQRIGNALGVAVVGIALFGTLAATAPEAADAAVPQLRADLTEAFGSQATADAAVAEFADCFTARAAADDPIAPIPGCSQSEPVPGDPIDDAFVAASNTALKANFSRAIQVAALFALGAVIATGLLVFLLPARIEHSA